jgi:hypothetical protein
MAAVLKNNNVGGVDAEVSVSVEQDEDVCLFLGGQSVDGGSADLWDYYTNDRAEIEDFFDMVKRAEADYRKLLAENG